MYLLTIARIYVALRNGHSISTEGGASSPQTQKVQEVFLSPYKKQQTTTQHNNNNCGNNHSNNSLMRARKSLLIEFVTFATVFFLLLVSLLAINWCLGEEHREYSLMLNNLCLVSTLHIFLPLICFIYRPHIPRAIVKDIFNYQSNAIYSVSS